MNMSWYYICVSSYLCDLWPWLVSTRSSSLSSTNVCVLQKTEICHSLGKTIDTPRHLPPWKVRVQKMGEQLSLKDSPQESRQTALFSLLNRVSSTLQNISRVQLAGIWKCPLSFWLNTLNKGRQKINAILAMDPDTIIVTKYSCIRYLPVHHYHVVMDGPLLSH